MVIGLSCTELVTPVDYEIERPERYAVPVTGLSGMVTVFRFAVSLRAAMESVWTAFGSGLLVRHQKRLKVRSWLKVVVRRRPPGKAAKSTTFREGSTKSGHSPAGLRTAASAGTHHSLNVKRLAAKRAYLQPQRIRFDHQKAVVGQDRWRVHYLTPGTRGPPTTRPGAVSAPKIQSTT